MGGWWFWMGKDVPLVAWKESYTGMGRRVGGWVGLDGERPYLDIDVGLDQGPADLLEEVVEDIVVHNLCFKGGVGWVGGWVGWGGGQEVCCFFLSYRRGLEAAERRGELVAQFLQDHGCLLLLLVLVVRLMGGVGGSRRLSVTAVRACGLAMMVSLPAPTRSEPVFARRCCAKHDCRKRVRQ